MLESSTRSPYAAIGAKPAPARTETKRCAAGEFRDRTARVIGVPFFGLGIPRVTGLFGPLTWTDAAYWGGTLWFVAISLAVWQGNRALQFWHRRYLECVPHTGWRIGSLLAVNLLYTAAVAVAMLVAWYLAAPLPAIDWRAVAAATILILVAVTIITLAYEIVMLMQESREDRLQVSMAERARWRAELETLKGQLAPHFLFNCLNTLAVLIEEEPCLAKRFNQRLASVCRYLLQHKDRNLVPVGDELEFFAAYADLTRVRHLDQVKVVLTGFENLDGLFIPPASLQLLLENAVKHNTCSAGEPLMIEVRLEGDRLIVSNPIRPHPTPPPTVGVGLQNLRERFQLVAGGTIAVSTTNDTFQVILPLVRSAPEPQALPAS